MIKYEIQHYTFCDGWINTWADDDGAHIVFDSKEAANEELNSFLADTLDGFNAGYLDEPYSVNEFRIVSRQ